MTKQVKYDEANPQIWREFERISRSAKERGIKHWSARGVLYVIRYETAARADNAKYKVDNNMSPYYARKMMFMFPEFKGFFNIRGEESQSKL